MRKVRFDPFLRLLESGDERAAPFLAQIGGLYAIEQEHRPADAATRATVRSRESLAWLLPMDLALKRAAADPAILPHGSLSKAVHYALCQRIDFAPANYFSRYHQS